MRVGWPGFGRETHRYMRGQCCDLAFALSEAIPGGELVGIGGSARFTDHVALRVGDLYLDARGLSDEEGFREGLGSSDGGIFPMTRDDVLGQMGLSHMAAPRSPELTKARAVARRLAGWRPGAESAFEAAGPGGPRP